MVNYLSRFVPRLSDLSAPLREFSNRSEEEWQSTETAAKVFTDIKTVIAVALSMKYFDPELKTVVQCDKSPTGLGAATLQAGQPVAFASGALSKTEQNCCQLEKELLVIVFAMHHFDQYVYAHHVWVSDYKPIRVCTPDVG